MLPADVHFVSLDLLYNARLDTPPRYPCSRQPKPMVQEGLWTPDLEAHQKLKTSGECFRPSPDASLPTAPYLEPKMVKLLEVMAETTVALDHYCRGGPGAPDSLMCWQITAIGHHMPFYLCLHISRWLCPEATWTSSQISIPLLSFMRYADSAPFSTTIWSCFRVPHIQESSYATRLEFYA